jgi:hypothetical protein
MTAIELQVRFLMAWTHVRVQALRKDPERGDGILIWVIMTALLAAAAITIVTIIVTKAKDQANNTQVQ